MSSDYTCTLSDTSLKKAQSELNEDPATRMKFVAELRDKLKARQDLRARTDDEFLLRFLRARKFDLHRAYDLAINYYKVRYQFKDVFANFVPSAVQHVLDDGVGCLLPLRDQEGRSVFYMRPGKNGAGLFAKHVCARVLADQCGLHWDRSFVGKWDPEKYAITDVLRANVMALEYALMEEETQTNGVVVIANFENVGFSHAMQIGPSYGRKVATIIQEALPLRLKQMNMLREPTLFDIVFAVIRQFMKAKLLSRIKLHGWELNTLHEQVDPSCLPHELEGTGGPLDTAAWKTQLMAAEPQFIYNNSFGFLTDPDAVAVPVTSQHDAIEGTVGSFRRLNVD